MPSVSLLIAWLVLGVVKNLVATELPLPDPAVHGHPGVVALVVFGYSFRWAKPRSRYGGPGGDSIQGYAAQQAAVGSQVDLLCRPLVFDLNYTAVHVHLFLQNSTNNHWLHSWYSMCGRVFVHPEPPGGLQLGDVFNSSDTPNLPTSFFENWTYEAAVLTRPDVSLKPYFGPVLLRANRSKYLSVFRLEVHKEADAWVECTVRGTVCNAGIVVWLPGWALPHITFYPKFLVTHHDAFLRLAPLLGWSNIDWFLPQDRARSNPGLECNSLFTFAGRMCSAARNRDSYAAYPHEETELVYHGRVLKPSCLLGSEGEPCLVPKK